MTATSDLDLVLLYRHDPDATLSDGPRQIPPSAYYGRLIQRLVAALSAPTGEGVLYPVDLRLRPSGRSGPLAAHLEGFRTYHQKEAWTWEQMALVRSRPVAGKPELCKAVTEIVREALCIPRDRQQTANAVLDMRRRLALLGGEDDIWDVKFAAGGLVDIEFIEEYLVLMHAHAHPELIGGTTVEVLDRARGFGLLDGERHDVLRRAARVQHEITQILRLCVADRFVPEQAGLALERLLGRATGHPTLESLATELTELQRAARAIFLAVLEEGASS
jgi:glutamate-ammonia-ligase adenylyltransferase